ncbi:MAG: hypothetical protein ACQEQU_06055 [Spirochaetota bacterium]
MLGFILWANLTLGLQDYTEAMPGYRYTHPPVYAQIELNAQNDWLLLYGEYVNEMNQYDLGSYFTPMQDYFTIGAELGSGVVFGVEHMCQHPVATFGHDLQGEYGGYTKVFVRISTRKNNAGGF